MSADSPYYIYYARDDEEPHFVFLDYSFTCLHLSHTYLQATFTTSITLNPRKCEFHKDKIDFLGVELSANGFEMECVKIKAIQDWKPPCNVKAIREFISFCNFYHHFVKNFAKVAWPLHDLTKHNAPWEWGPQQQHTFETLKGIICASLVLIHANPDKKFHIETDALNYAYGTILSQKKKEDQKQGDCDKTRDEPSRVTDRGAWGMVLTKGRVRGKVVWTVRSNNE